MKEDPKDTLSIFASAVRELLRDKELTYADPSERAIVARLRNLLDGKYHDWSIDLERNRHRDVIKRLRYELTEEVLISKGAIVPDLIVHRVGQNENLLVVEVKKSTNNDFDGDIWKLRGMTDQKGDYAYSVGIHLVVDAKAGVAPRCDVYIDAAADPALTAWMREQLP
jgi:molybdopterin converting factor small subunit